MSPMLQEDSIIAMPIIVSSSNRPSTSTSSSLSYPGWETDKEAAERIQLNHSSISNSEDDQLFQEKMVAMKTKQKLFEGDRSDPSIVALDSTKFTYKGFESDKAEAERRLSGDCSVLQLGSYGSFYNSMMKKEALEADRSSVVALHELDELALTYPKCEIDKATAEQYFTDYQTPVRFTQKVAAMKNKQQLHEGDRSHPDIVALDQAIMMTSSARSSTFTYNNWHRDEQEYLDRHTGDCTLFQFGITCQFLLTKMLKKEKLQTNNRSNSSLLLALDNSHFTYTDWKADKKQAEGYYTDFTSPERFQQKLQAMKNKQRLLVNKDRSHPDLVALDHAIARIVGFRYPGFDADRTEAENRHIGDCTVLQLGLAGFSLTLTKLKKRQAQYESKFRNTSPTTDSLVRLVVCPGIHNVQPSSPPPPPPPLPVVAVTSKPVVAPAADETNPANDSCTANNNNNPCNSSDDKKCVVCLEDEPRYAFIPCGHLCVCSGCIPSFEEQDSMQCPMCRKTALVLTRIYA